METFTGLRKFKTDPYFHEQKLKTLQDLYSDMIDLPLVNLINGFNGLPYCFTLQCCYGHFVYPGQEDAHNLNPLPKSGVTGTIEYRIAYIAFCIKNNKSGRYLSEELEKITAIDRENIQFGCAEWFWERQVNSYALQVEPDRFKYQDMAYIEYEEALHVEWIRNKFYKQLYDLLENLNVK